MARVKQMKIVGISPTGYAVLFPSPYEAAKELNGDASNIRKAVNYGYRVGGWRWVLFSDFKFPTVPMTPEIKKTFEIREPRIPVEKPAEPEEIIEDPGPFISYRERRRIETSSGNYSYGYFGDLGPSICPVCKRVLTSLRHNENGFLVQGAELQHIRECVGDKECERMLGGVLRVKIK